jgi:hypothetical protein
MKSVILSEANPAIRYNSSAFKPFFYSFFVASLVAPKSKEKLAFSPAGFPLLSGLGCVLTKSK